MDEFDCLINYEANLYKEARDKAEKDYLSEFSNDNYNNGFEIGSKVGNELNYYLTLLTLLSKEKNKLGKKIEKLRNIIILNINELDKDFDIKNINKELDIIRNEFSSILKLLKIKTTKNSNINELF